MIADDLLIRSYQPSDELQWVRCRVLAFLDSAYYDNVLRAKEKYQNLAIELICQINGQIVGLIDVEYETVVGSVCSNNDNLNGMIWHLAVLPEFRKRGIAGRLLQHAIALVKNQGVTRLEAWTRDDQFVLDWYHRQGFAKKQTYLHVFTENDECDLICDPKIRQLYLCGAFAHYIGDQPETIKKQFARVHECSMYELMI